ncbi:MAG: sporulation membrane protein YtaF [Halanaerobium sp.]|nr:sporulation membrane protein YtaF [Halanaerobium sp.]
MELLYIFTLGIAISMDGFFVGLTYGLRKINIKLIPLVLISSISGLSIFITIICGNLLGSLLSPEYTEFIGGAILILVGIWIIAQNLRHGFVPKDKTGKDELETNPVIFSLQVPWLGIAIQILREPIRADFDHSGTINNREALFLGIALALDAVGAGLGAGLSGTHFLLTPIAVTMLNMLFLRIGSLMGNSLESITSHGFSFLPGLLMVFLGLVKFI